jgi:hypothetical protein
LNQVALPTTPEGWEQIANCDHLAVFIEWAHALQEKNGSTSTPVVEGKSDLFVAGSMRILLNLMGATTPNDITCEVAKPVVCGMHVDAQNPATPFPENEFQEFRTTNSVKSFLMRAIEAHHIMKSPPAVDPASELTSSVVALTGRLADTITKDSTIALDFNPVDRAAEIQWAGLGQDLNPSNDKLRTFATRAKFEAKAGRKYVGTMDEDFIKVYGPKINKATSEDKDKKEKYKINFWAAQMAVFNWLTLLVWFQTITPSAQAVALGVFFMLCNKNNFYVAFKYMQLLRNKMITAASTGANCHDLSIMITTVQSELMAEASLTCNPPSKNAGWDEHEWKNKDWKKSWRTKDGWKYGTKRNWWDDADNESDEDSDASKKKKNKKKIKKEPKE